MFDVGGTLLEPRPSVGTLYAQVAKKYGVQVAPEILDDRFRQAWKDNKTLRQLIDKSWWRRIVDRVFAPFRVSDPEKFFEELYDLFRRPEAWQIFPDVHDTLKALKKGGFKLAVASNWDSRLPDLLQNLGLAPYFDRQFVSFVMGVDKSDPAFYRLCLEQLELNPLEVVHVGDDEENDYRSPTQAGIRSYIITRTGVPSQPYHVGSLRDIMPAVLKLA